MKDKITFASVLKQVKAYFIITLGLISYVLGWEIFLIPQKLVGGGVTGISSILFYAFGIPISISFFVINTILLLIAIKLLGKAFGAKTIYAIVLSSLLFQFVPQLIPQDFIQEIAINNGKLICAIFGGVMAGLGIGLAFTQGGSSGGTDIVALIVAKYRNIAPGRMILYMDLVIIACSLLIPAKEVEVDGKMVMESWGMRFATVLYGYMLVASCSTIIDLVVSGSRQSVQLFIFSSKYEQIADAITKLGRGVSVIDSQGWYTKNSNKMLIVIVHKQEVARVQELIKEIDKESFIALSSVTGVYGQGFQPLSNVK